MQVLTQTAGSKPPREFSKLIKKVEDLDKKIPKVISEHYEEADISDTLDYLDIGAELLLDESEHDDIRERVGDHIRESSDVVGYRNAMDYLIEADTSLDGAIALAVDLGYELKDVNSELLASILKSEETLSSFNDVHLPDVMDDLEALISSEVQPCIDYIDESFDNSKDDEDTRDEIHAKSIDLLREALIGLGIPEFMESEISEIE